jgi:hypothetical protein
MYAVSIYYSIQIDAKLSFSAFLFATEYCALTWNISMARFLVPIWKTQVKSMLLFIGRRGNNEKSSIIHFLPSMRRFYCIGKEKTMIYFIYSKSPFGYLVSIIYGSIFLFGVLFRLFYMGMNLKVIEVDD